MTVTSYATSPSDQQPNRPNWPAFRPRPQTSLFGGTAGEEIAEVQVNETVAGAASQSLGTLDWPRLGQPAYTPAHILDQLLSNPDNPVASTP
ncbi:hypothetical protein [Nocardia brasiliensis]|uniref:hypothetical protein n=1 Tax=Nocardia brasiliensis TaxID=37326 RepID=UPI00025275CF|nr:hypothetical protein [Nocardia brasiliensis]